MPMIRAHYRRYRTYRARRPSTRSDYPYEQREALLSRGELAFFRALMGAIRGAYLVSLKTRLADVVKCPDHLWDSVHGRRLSQKHVDFVLYDPITTAIRAVVELDDRSHDEPERQRRDRFLEDVLGSTGVILIRIRASSRYPTDQLRRKLSRLD